MHLCQKSVFNEQMENNTSMLVKIQIIFFQIPSTLNCTLREYQTKGFRWLVSNLLNGFGVRFFVVYAYIFFSNSRNLDSIRQIPKGLKIVFTKDVFKFLSHLQNKKRAFGDCTPPPEN